MPVLVSFQTIPEMFLNLCAQYDGRSKTSFAYKPKGSEAYHQISWDHYAHDVYAVACWLRNHGLKRGDRVGILSENRYEWAVTDMAMQLLGLVNTALYPSLPPNQVEYILQDSQSKILFVSSGIQLKKAVEVFDRCMELTTVVAFDDAANAAHMAKPYVRRYEDILENGKALIHKMEGALLDEARAVDIDALATLIYTSGTTGQQKGVMLTHRNICANVHNAVLRINIGPSDRLLSFLPLSHSFERTGGYYAAMACGCEIYYAESVETVAKNMAECRPTVVVSVPRLFERIYGLVQRSVEEGSDLKKRIFRWAVKVGKAYADGKRGLVSVQRALADRLVFAKLRQRTGGNIRFFVSGGAALPPEIGSFFAAAGLTIVEGYGLTETSPVISVNPQDAPRIGTVGHVIPGVTVAIQRLSDGKIVAELAGDAYPSHLDSEEGEILCKGHNVMLGYWNKPGATQEVMDELGWFHTGDIGRFTKGYLQITDRLKHMIVNAGGKNIYPGPIEDLIKTIPYVEQAVLLGERKNFMSALIVPDYDALKVWAKNQGIAYASERDLLFSPPVKELYAKEIKHLSSTLASHEKIRDFRLIADPFTVETGEITPTLKVKRKVIEEKYRELIEEMYRED